MQRMRPLLRENMLVTLKFPERDPDTHYPSRVEWITEEEMGLAAPTEGNVVMPVRVGEAVVVVAVVGRKVHQASTTATGRLSAQVPCLVVRVPVDWELVGRREWFRVHVALPLRWNSSPDGSMEDMIALTREISGGGMRINVMRHTPGYQTARELTRGQPLTLLLELPGSRVRCIGELVQKHEQSEGVELSIRFAAIAARDRERIIRYCFDVEREALRKGLVET